jgi:uncharacterized Zn finger protein
MNEIRVYPKKCPVCSSKKIIVNPNFGMRCNNCGYCNLRRVKIKEENLWQNAKNKEESD